MTKTFLRIPVLSSHDLPPEPHQDPSAIDVLVFFDIPGVDDPIVLPNEVFRSLIIHENATENIPPARVPTRREIIEGIMAEVAVSRGTAGATGRSTASPAPTPTPRAPARETASTARETASAPAPRQRADHNSPAGRVDDSPFLVGEDAGRDGRMLNRVDKAAMAEKANGMDREALLHIATLPSDEFLSYRDLLDNLAKGAVANLRNRLLNEAPNATSISSLEVAQMAEPTLPKDSAMSKTLRFMEKESPSTKLVSPDADSVDPDFDRLYEIAYGERSNYDKFTAASRLEVSLDNMKKK